MKQLLSILAIAVFCFAGCAEDEPATPACEVENFGLLTVMNTASFAVDVSINNQDVGSIVSGGEEHYKIPPGSYNLYAIERNGGLFPTEWESNSTIEQCQIKEATLRE